MPDQKRCRVQDGWERAHAENETLRDENRRLREQLRLIDSEEGQSRDWVRGYDEGFYAHRDNTRKEMLQAIDNILGTEKPGDNAKAYGSQVEKLIS
jgi:hypothetical protein